jgi:excisionase family DNA binding protein
MDDNNHSGALTQAPPVTYLTPKDVQRELRIGERLCYKLLKEGSIPSVRVGGLYRIPRKQLEKELRADPRPFGKRIV